jgi:uncharacterized protein with HEPN domain
MPLEDKDLGRLHDMLTWGREALELLGTESLETFINDRRTYLAVLHCVQIVGEAGWSLSDDIKASMTEIPWPLIAGMRHRLVHDYGRIDPQRIYSVLQQGLPDILQVIESLLRREVDDQL